MYLLISILGFFVLGITFYLVLPDLFLYRLGIGSWKRNTTPGVVLSFDDGPDPTYTPQVLEVLRKYNAPAIFFVVGEKAQKYPQVIQDILRDGHQLGAHGQYHVSARHLSPWRTWREWNHSIDMIEKVSGTKISFIRPPFGAFNLALWLWCIRKQKLPVYWTASGHDWFIKQTPIMIASEVLKNIGNGSIILLHDSEEGEKGAPENTIQALNIICKKILYHHGLSIVQLKLPTL